MDWHRITEREYYEWSDRLRLFFEATGLRKICSGMCKGNCCQRIGCARCVIMEDEEEPLSCLSYMCSPLRNDLIASIKKISKSESRKFRELANYTALLISRAFDYPGSFVFMNFRGVNGVVYHELLYAADFGWNSHLYIAEEGVRFMDSIDKIIPVVAGAVSKLIPSCQKHNYDKCSCARTFRYSPYPDKLNAISFMRRSELKDFVCGKLSIDDLVLIALERAEDSGFKIDLKDIDEIVGYSDVYYKTEIYQLDTLYAYREYVNDKKECEK